MSIQWLERKGTEVSWARGMSVEALRFHIHRLEYDLKRAQTSPLIDFDRITDLQGALFIARDDLNVRSKRT